MATYNQAAITARLNGVVTAIGATGSLILYAGGAAIATFPLNNPCGVVSDSVLTFSGTPIIVTAADDGTLTEGKVINSDGTLGITGLTVGVDDSSDIVVSNGLNSLVVTAGQNVALLAGQIETLGLDNQYLLLEGGSGFILLESGGLIIIGP